MKVSSKAVCSVLGLLLSLVLINDLVDELTYNHLFFFEDDVKLIASRRQQHERRSSTLQPLHWPGKWGIPLNASKCHHRGIIVNSALTLSANVVNVANEARGMVFFIKRSFT